MEGVRVIPLVTQTDLAYSIGAAVVLAIVIVLLDHLRGRHDRRDQ